MVNPDIDLFTEILKIVNVYDIEKSKLYQKLDTMINDEFKDDLTSDEIKNVFNRLFTAVDICIPGMKYSNALKYTKEYYKERCGVD